MMTGLNDHESIDQAFNAGATDFITKPISYPLLKHRVRYLLRASAAMSRLHESERQLANAQRIARLGYWRWSRGLLAVEPGTGTSPSLSRSVRRSGF